MTPILRSIKSINVKKLFGTYDYLLSPQSGASNPDKLLILYGDNGSGKTTILKCLFHLLAPEDDEGHKTQVARIPFQRFEILFNTGDRVWAHRPGTRLTGSFEMGLKVGRKTAVSVEMLADERNSIKPKDEKHNERIKKFLKALAGIDVSLYLLSDDRTVRLAGRNNPATPSIFGEVASDAIFYIDESRSNVVRRTARRTRDLEEIAQQLLVQSLQRAEGWIQTRVLTSSLVGESSVNSLYSEILKRLSQAGGRTKPEPKANKRGIEERIQRLGVRSLEYSRYGLMPEFNGKDIIKALSAANSASVPVIGNVLNPYLESVEKKLDAMTRIYSQINTLVEVINSFFTHKSISFEMNKGFQLRTDSGKTLAPQSLSSGERHLLLLFCNTLIALDRASVFIIDEPEISLNIKWQKKLLSALMKCVGDNPVQYVFATHSLELLAQHRKNVLKLS